MSMFPYPRLLTTKDWTFFAAEDFFELTKLVIAQHSIPTDIDTIFAKENQYKTVDIYYLKDGKEKEIEFNYFHLEGKIDGEKYLGELEEIFYSAPCIDCDQIISHFQAMITSYLKGSE